MDIANVISTCLIKKYLGSRVHYLGQNAYGMIFGPECLWNDSDSLGGFYSVYFLFHFICQKSTD